MLNWLSRYAFVVAELGFGQDGALLESVLDIGCGPHGLACAVPGAEFVGVDVSFPGPVAQGMTAICTEPGPLPFEDATFETVICLDVLEHVPRPDRAGFVAEIARVASRRVLLACPSSEAAWIDGSVRDLYERRGEPLPDWLTEHYEHVLPTPEEIRGVCEAVPGFEARELQMTNGLLSTLAVWADVFPESAQHAANEFRDNHQQWLQMFISSRFGSCYRKGFAIERVPARRPRVLAGSIKETLWDAMRCPVCGNVGLLDRGSSATCRNCASAYGRGETGAIDLNAPSADQRPVLSNVASARTNRLLLRPDWADLATWVPVLWRYVAGSSPDLDCALCIDVVESDLGLPTLQQLVATVCEVAAAGRAFSDVILLDTPYETGELRQVESVEQLLAAVSLDPVTRPADAAAAVAHAVAVKQICDGLTQTIEQRRYRMAPDPWSSREPLVTVRIATWKGHQILIERTLPSVLAGSYQNLEVVVCSDGPDPEARQAIEAVADPRIRYIEVPERPVYPAQPWSFWLTAGSCAMNHAVDAARGDFIFPLDHDDAFTNDHIEVMLQAAAEDGADFVYGQALMEEPNGSWSTVGREPLTRAGDLTHGAIMFSSRLRHVRVDPYCWLRDEPGDWNMSRHCLETGARIAFVPQVVLAHFGERTSLSAHGDAASTRRRFEDRQPADIVADLQRTGIDWMLDLPLDR